MNKSETILKNLLDTIFSLTDLDPLEETRIKTAFYKANKNIESLPEQKSIELALYIAEMSRHNPKMIESVLGISVVEKALEIEKEINLKSES